MCQIPYCVLLIWERIVLKSMMDELRFSEWAVQDGGGRKMVQRSVAT